MLREIIAPNEEKIEPGYCKIFLAGGITKCPDWQRECINYIRDFKILDSPNIRIEETEEDIAIFNPRRDTFDITDKNASEKQITWEFNRLEECDIFSMYFCESESVQPICMYELGRNVARMQVKYPNDWRKRIIVSVEEGYSRKQDVVIQMSLSCPDLKIDTCATPTDHANKIINRYIEMYKL